MKQHITVEQLNELSEKGKEKLRKWWKPEYGDYYAYHRHTYKGIWKYSEHIYIDQMGYDIVDPTIGSDNEPGERDYPLLSIGQMIEFLDDDLDSIEYEKMPDEYYGNLEYPRYEVSICNHEKHIICTECGKDKTGCYKFYSNIELCDALWEAVKEVLEGNDKLESFSRWDHAGFTGKNV